MNLEGGSVPPFKSLSNSEAANSLITSTIQQQLNSLAGQLLSVATTISKVPSPKPSQGDLSDHEIAHRLRQVIFNRRMRERYFTAELFADPAWDILLDLTVARLENRQICVSSLAIAASVPASTALRWIKTLLDSSLIERVPDPTDRRRTNICMSDKAFANMVIYAKALGSAF